MVGARQSQRFELPLAGHHRPHRFAGPAAVSCAEFQKLIDATWGNRKPGNVRRLLRLNRKLCLFHPFEDGTQLGGQTELPEKTSRRQPISTLTN